MLRELLRTLEKELELLSGGGTLTYADLNPDQVGICQYTAAQPTKDDV